MLNIEKQMKPFIMDPLEEHRCYRKFMEDGSLPNWVAARRAMFSELLRDGTVPESIRDRLFSTEINLDQTSMTGTHEDDLLLLSEAGIIKLLEKEALRREEEDELLSKTEATRPILEKGVMEVLPLSTFSFTFLMLVNLGFFVLVLFYVIQGGGEPFLPTTFSE